MMYSIFVIIIIIIIIIFNYNYINFMAEIGQLIIKII